MQKRNHSQIIFLLDLALLYASFWLVFFHYRGGQPIPLNGTMLMGFVGLAWFVIALNSNVRTVNRQSRMFDVLQSILVGYSVLTTAVIAVVAILGDFRHNDKLILYPLLIAFTCSTVFRFFYLITIKHFVKNGYQQKSVLLIGGDRVAERVMNRIRALPELGYRLHGILADKYHESMPRGVYLGRLDRFSEIVRSGLVDEVIIALPLRREKEIICMVDKCEQEGIRVQIVPDFFRVIHSRVILDQLDDVPLIAIRPEPLGQYRNRLIKRGFDIVFSLAVLVLLSPLFLVLAIVIKLSSPGPVFFKQKRVGVNNKEFFLYKFRSMQMHDEKESDTVWTTAHDGRVTKIGEFMRRTNLDEMPQFWNVLIGDMSVVGPRPERGHFVEQFRKDIPHYKVRHLVKSGISGWAQVNGLRGDTSIADRVAHDVQYMENWTFWYDIKIILLTLFGRKARRNAY